MNDPNRTVTPDPNDLKAIAAQAPSADQPGRIGRYRIEKVLGEGGFGRVYLAHDEQLNRPVAIKVPHARFTAQAVDAESYLTEARTVASLDHPNIVPVYDVGSTEQFPCFTVSKYVDGADLGERIRQARMSLRDAVEVVATVAEALHHAHKHGLVHRDIKPSNILLDKSGKPFVGDFGMALREQDVGKGPRYAGTPAYMSPEQARGEGHRVDGRSDIFSLGVVLYELLVGRRPFKADSQEKLLEQIKTVEAKPPRQIDDKIPKELERVCLKALSKRASDRYTTEKDLADDLRHFLAHATSGQTLGRSSDVQSGGSLVVPVLTPSRGPTETLSVTPTPITPASPPSESQQVKIVPKGLRSFDAHDADFFLELLPGPRDRDGLPDSLRFWKSRIEETDPSHTFLVGLIYGPSGCGKSSLVKAGLLPRLSDDVMPVYVEATAEDTENRLLIGLRKRCAALAPEASLKETLAALRRGHGIPVGKKVLIVVDQFEQWLHAHRESHDTELVQAIRQCDGNRVQCIVMVRDDFWMAATRFMREIEVRLIEGDNSAAVDLFDMHHAGNVLAAFGRAFGRLPSKLSEISKDHEQFLQRSVSGLAQEGKVICVRMALFAEMMKGRPWTPSSLKEVGGTEGIGVTFLEETFGAPSAPPEHRFYQKGARSVLKALLPESGTDIKGHMRSYAELLGTSGYAEHPDDFDYLLRILDVETRLITPSDPEGAQAETPLPQARAGKFFQLTHDYLVASLREWLTRRQKETRQGRAELLLADRVAMWTATPEHRYLPTTGEYLRIRLLTHSANWSPPQRTMMKTAGRVQRLHGLLVVAVLCLASIAGITIRQRFLESQRATRAEDIVNGLVKADIAHVLEFVGKLDGYRNLADPLLREKFEHSADDSADRLHVAIALVANDPRAVDYLRERLLSATTQQFIIIREALAPFRATVVESLWEAVTDRKHDARQRFQAACALATFDPSDIRWSGIAKFVAEELCSTTPISDFTLWRNSLQDVQKILVGPLSIIYSDVAEREQIRACAAEALADYLKTSPADLFSLLTTAEPFQFETMLTLLNPHRREAIPLAEAEIKKTVPWKSDEAERESLAHRQVNAAVALIRWGSADNVWPMLKHSADSRARTELIHAVDSLDIDPQSIINRWEQEPDAIARASLVQMLAEFAPSRLPVSERLPLIEKLKLVDEFQNNPDPALHSSIEWMLGRWEQKDLLKSAVDKLRKPAPPDGTAPANASRWYVDRQGQTFAIMDATEFLMGAPDVDRVRGVEKGRHSVKIGRRIAVATTLVSRGQYRAYQEAENTTHVADDPGLADIVRTDDSPQTAVTWYGAAHYCNWLSKQEKLPECYVPNSDGNYAPGMKAVDGYLELSGYRLPTEAEWEFACRAGTITSRCYGSSLALLPKYAYFAVNADGHTWPVATLKPNDFGLFDVHGNAWQWCDDVYRTDLHAKNTDPGSSTPVVDADRRVLRGGSFDAGARYVRSAARLFNQPSNRLNSYGFRPVRTMSTIEK